MHSREIHFMSYTYRHCVMWMQMWNGILLIINQSRDLSMAASVHIVNTRIRHAYESAKDRLNDLYGEEEGYLHCSRNATFEIWEEVQMDMPENQQQRECISRSSKKVDAAKEGTEQRLKLTSSIFCTLKLIRRLSKLFTGQHVYPIVSHAVGLQQCYSCFKIF